MASPSSTRTTPSRQSSRLSGRNSEAREDVTKDHHQSETPVKSKSDRLRRASASPTKKATAASARKRRKTLPKRRSEKKPEISPAKKHPGSSTKKSKQEKLIDEWAALQTSHFSEIEDFELSFVE